MTAWKGDLYDKKTSRRYTGKVWTDFKANFDDRINILESIEDACNKFGAEYNYYRLSILAYAKQNIADAIKYAKKSYWWELYE